MRNWILCALILCSGSQSIAQSKCLDIFAGQIENSLARQSSLRRTIHELALLHLRLDLETAQGNSSAHLIALRHEYQKKESAFIAYLLAEKIMSQDDFIEKIRNETALIQGELSIQETTQETERRTQEQAHFSAPPINGEILTFHAIQPGSFFMGDAKRQVETEIDYEFEISATLVTQIVWRRVVETAQRKFPNRYDNLNGTPSNFVGGLNPVENISYSEIQLWLKAFRDLAKRNDPIIFEITTEHLRGDTYRLPTEAEWELAMHRGGAENGLYHYSSFSSNHDRHAWYRENSEGKTHPVGLMEAMEIGNKQFFYFHGNVAEFVNDGYDRKLSGGLNPMGPSNHESKVLVGGSWAESKSLQRLGYRRQVGIDERSSEYGFRLVRVAR
jgi:formylglycine-generating enzyme required for sulfatase activity